MEKPLGIVYFGTADFAVTALERLITDPKRFRILAVVSQPDKPTGRTGTVTASPVAKVAHSRNLTLLQPAKIRGNTEFAASLKALTPDFFVVAAYGKILPAELLSIPTHGAVNLHGSLLPSYRGASPIQAAILAGETKTGVTLMLMDAEMDHGPTYARAETPIEKTDTYTSLSRRLADLSAKLLTDDLTDVANGQLTPSEQDHAAAGFTKIIAKEDGQVDWTTDSAEFLQRKIRAYDPWPGVFTTWRHNGKPQRLKILTAQAIPEDNGRRAGEIFMSPSGRPAIRAVTGALELLTVQMEGKKPQDSRDFLRGYRDFVGSVL